MTKIAIHGAAGRMGQRLMSLIGENDALQLVAAIERAGHSALGQDVGGLYGVKTAAPLTLDTTLAARCDAVIDFSLPAGTRHILEVCVQQKVALVIGTTGLTRDDHAAIDRAAASIPVLQAPNMSLGVNLLLMLVAEAAKRLGDDYDIEITESHHHHKKDAPSGTALGLAEAICEATGKRLDQDVIEGYYGKDRVRHRGQIGIHALRLGDVVGEHTVYYASQGERLELSHIATDRDIFARGALRAAQWLVGRANGRYRMADVLGG